MLPIFKRAKVIQHSYIIIECTDCFIHEYLHNANDQQISLGLTRSEMFDEILTILTAGYETTSTALTWFRFYMSKYPQVQQRMKEELCQHNLLMREYVQYLPFFLFVQNVYNDEFCFHR
ncbi:unnamed protein product [Rotaria sordida]|uniref:Cytochrome P450 n=1 Tax=Rotaria sordida TaxID=392033 RepID=A0A815G594_9BILA|nr:unnamed protein product [Rotaria sordida]CAF1593345.1 unnamed protein product [Rotaria sordida]